jgi:hypothetical protein
VKLLAALAAALTLGGASQPTRLVVAEQFVGPGRYIEGSLWHLRIAHRGQALVDRYVRKTTLALTVAPGAYVVTSYQRPCDGNCGYLDGPTDRCSATVTVPRARTLHVTVLNRTAATCSIRTRVSR